MKLDAIWTYPCKGLAGVTHDRIGLEEGCLLPGDRLFGIHTGKAEPVDHQGCSPWQAKRHFAQLLNSAALAGYRLEYDKEACQLSLHRGGQVLIRCDADNPDLVADRLYQDCPEVFAAPPSLVRCHQGSGFTDTKAPFISIVSQASLERFAAATGTKADSRRFRLNLVLKEVEPFAELAWQGKYLSMGDAVIELIEPVERCAAINVSPDTARIDGRWYQMMDQIFGHRNMGMFGRVVCSGDIHTGQKAELQDTPPVQPS